MSEVIELRPKKTIDDILGKDATLERLTNLVDSTNITALDKILRVCQAKSQFAYAATRLSVLGDKMNIAVYDLGQVTPVRKTSNMSASHEIY